MAVARKPEDCDLLLIEALNAGDLEAAVALYEPNASFVAEPGKVVSGTAAIREQMQGFLAIKPKFTLEVSAAQSGDIALLNSKWKVTGTDAEGKAVTIAGNGVEVVRRQGDGSWRFVVDSPNGGAA